MTRRIRLGSWSALATAVLLTGTFGAQAQDWPSRPIRFVVPVAPGGATDVTARLLQEPISKALGVVLRRYGMSRKERARMIDGETVEPNGE